MAVFRLLWLVFLSLLQLPSFAACTTSNYRTGALSGYATCAALASALQSTYGGASRTCQVSGSNLTVCESGTSNCAIVSYDTSCTPDPEPPTCVPPQVLNEDQTACVTPPPADCKSGRIIGSGYLSYGDSGSSTWCQGGCEVRPQQYVLDGNAGAAYANGNHYQTGESCTPTEEAEKPAPQPDPTLPPNAPSCQAGYYYGQINGQTVCVPGSSVTKSDPPKTTTTTKPDGSGTVTTTGTTTTTGSTSNGTPTTTTTWGTETMRWDVTQPSQNVGAPPAGATVPTATGETKTSTVTNPDGSVTKHEVTKKADGTYDVKSTNGTVEKTENTTTCTGSSCITSTTKSENGATTETTTGEGSKDGICKETPSNPVCGTGNEGMFGGSCSAGFICEGDAVQCAMAKKQHESLCALMENNSAESQLYDSEKAKTGNVTGDNPNNGSVALGSGLFDYSSALGGGSCIPDKSITVMGTAINLPFSSICPWLAVLGNLLVAVSSLAAMRIVMRP